MISRVVKSGVMLSLIAGMVVAGSPGVFAEEPVPVAEAAKPDPAKAKEELKAILKELDAARRETDARKRAAAIKVAKAKLTLWNDTYKELRMTEAEKAARAAQNKELKRFLDRETAARAEKDLKKQVELLKALYKDLQAWRDKNCTEAGGAKDGLFTTTINCDSVGEVKGRVWELLLKKDPTITAIPTPIPTMVATTSPVPTLMPTPTPTSFVSIESMSSPEAMTDGDVDVDIFTQEVIEPLQTLVPAPTPTVAPVPTSTSTYSW